MHAFSYFELMRAEQRYCARYATYKTAGSEASGRDQLLIIKRHITHLLI